MALRYLKLKPLEAAQMQIVEANPLLSVEAVTVSNITDLGAAANPNTTATITGDGVNVVGSSTVAFNRLNPGATFSKFAGVIKRPAVRVFTENGMGGTVALSALASSISRSLGLNIDTTSNFKDVDGAQQVALPAKGGYVDYDIAVNQPNSLRFRPSATDKIPVRLYSDGQNWHSAVPKNDCRHAVPVVPDEFEKGLILYMPLGEDGSSAFRGQSNNISFGSAAAFAYQGDAYSTAAYATLRHCETAKKPSSVFHLPLNGNLTETVTGAQIHYQGTVNWPVPGGRNGVSMRFGSNSARINPPTSYGLANLLSGTNDWTIAFDFYAVDSAYWQQILGCYGGGAVNAKDSLAVMFYKGQLYTYTLSGTTSLGGVSVTGLLDSKWHRIEISRSNGKMRLFVDGVKRNEVDYTGSINVPVTPFQIGNSNDLSNPCTCYLRSLEIHNVALHTDDHVPEWWWYDSITKLNTVSMAGKEIATSTWKQIFSAVPTVGESSEAYLKWLFVIGGNYCTWDKAARKPVTVALADINGVGYTTSEFRDLMSELPFTGISSMGVVASLVTTRGMAAPTLTSLVLYSVIPAGNCATIGWTAPAPNAACSLRGGVGTQFSFGGYNLGRDVTNSKTDLDTTLQGNNEFTIEVDIQRTSLGGGISTDDTILWSAYEGGSQTEWLWLLIYQDGRVSFGQVDTSNTYRGGATTMAILDYLPHRIELVKKGDTLYCFVDGVLGGTVVMPTACVAGTASLHLGFGRVIHGSTNGLTRPFRGYMRDLKIYNYAKYVATHDVITVAPLVSGQIKLNGDAIAGALPRLPALQSLLYGVDFTEVFQSVGLSNITAASDATVLRGDIIAAINAKLAAVGISAVISTAATLLNTTVSNLYGIQPNAALGHNPNAASVITITDNSFANNTNLNINGSVTLHLMSAPVA